MKWQVFYSGRAHKFIAENHLESKVNAALMKFILRYTGETVTIDVKKLKGKWSGYHRIRIGNLRVIVKVDKERNSMVVDTVDLRDRIY